MSGLDAALARPAASGAVAIGPLRPARAITRRPAICGGHAPGHAVIPVPAIQWAIAHGFARRG